MATAMASLRTLCEELLADLVLDQGWDCTRLATEGISSVRWMALMRSTRRRFFSTGRAHQGSVHAG